MRISTKQIEIKESWSLMSRFWQWRIDRSPCNVCAGPSKLRYRYKGRTQFTCLDHQGATLRKMGYRA